MTEKMGLRASNATTIELPREGLDSLRRVLLGKLSYALQLMGYGEHASQDLEFTPPPRLMQNTAIYDSYLKYQPSQQDQTPSRSNHTSRSNQSDSIRPNVRTLPRRAILRRYPNAAMDHDDIKPVYYSESLFMRRLALAAMILAAVCFLCLIIWYLTRRFQRNKRLRKMKEEHGEPKEVRMVDHETEQYEPPPGPPWSAAPEARFHDVRL